MDPRKEQLLQLIIEQFIETAEPVGSKLLVANTDLDVSAPTVRNEMRDLEKEGYLVQPHTSAGRIPTEKGFRYYRDKILSLQVHVEKKDKKTMDDIKDQSEMEKSIKVIAKYITEKTHTAAFVSFGRDNVYYTGLSYLFAQPEFKQYAETVSISEVFDSYEEKVDELFDSVGSTTTVLIGSENPLAKQCTLIVTPFGKENLISIMGPMRMNYKQNIAIMNYLHSVLT